jgi:hypothetical protein
MIELRTIFSEGGRQQPASGHLSRLCATGLGFVEYNSNLGFLTGLQLDGSVRERREGMANRPTI